MKGASAVLILMGKGVALSARKGLSEREGGK